MRLKIASKIILGFGVMGIAVILYAMFANRAISKSRLDNARINSIYTPSVELIRDMYTKISDSRMLIKSWVHIDKISDTPDKIKLLDLHSKGYGETIDSLKILSEYWQDDTLKSLLYDIDILITDTLFPRHQYIMEQLNSFLSYEDPFIVFEMTDMVEDKGEVMLITNRALNKISSLLEKQEILILEKRVEMAKSFDSIRNFNMIMLVVMILVAIIVSTVLTLSLATPINRTKNMLLSISKGILPDTKLKEGNDEIGQMAIALHSVVKSLKDVSGFAIQIGKGNFESEFTPLSEDDVLGQSLLEMREELVKAKEEEDKRNEENKQRTWSSQGVALFSDILRKHSDNLKELSFEIVSNMVQYTKANQGGIFIVNDNDKDNICLEMTACYAYDRQKFIKRRVEVGEGLVGRCYQEQEKIFLTDIPNDYIKISSGLGEDNPKCLLLIPLTYNDKIYGILEIASFTVFENFEVEFMERIGESIAATISSVKANIQTQLLLEQSQQQAEEMSAQEEEMRQNMEELRATQEQSARREQELVRELEMLRRQMESV
ncbi:MAG: GAF domain-containing protein [Bacteroidales bacterium]|nr:GAF domain-containing protein [Bacteroidales bacterium]